MIQLILYILAAILSLIWVSLPINGKPILKFLLRALAAVTLALSVLLILKHFNLI